MKKRVLVSLVVVVGLAAGSAQAGSYALDLNALISDGRVTPSSSWGTLFIGENEDNSLGVDIAVSLNVSTQKIQQLYLNYDDTKFFDSDYFVASGTAIIDAQDGVKIPGGGGSKCILLDLQDPSKGNLGVSGSYSATLFGFSEDGTGIDLNVSDFYPRLDTTGQIWAAVHVGNVGTDGDSVTVGAAPVPLPGAALLLGSGLAGLSIVGRRKHS